MTGADEDLEDVGQKVEAHVEAGDEQHDRLDDGHVTVADRVNTMRSGMPLRRAICTYSLSRTSTMEARKMRTMYGETASTRVATGRTRMLSWCHNETSGLTYDTAGRM